MNKFCVDDNNGFEMRLESWFRYQMGPGFRLLNGMRILKFSSASFGTALGY